MRLVLIFFLTLVLGILFGIGIAPDVRKAFGHTHTWKQVAAATIPALPVAGTKTAKLPLPSPEDKDLNDLLHEPNIYKRTSGLMDYVDSIPAGSLGAELDRIAGLTDSDSELALALVSARWVAEDPEAARKAMLAAPSSRVRDCLLQDVFGALAVSNPVDAMKQAAQLVNEGQRNTAIAGALGQVAHDNPPLAISLVESLEPKQSYLLKDIFAEWANRDPEAATDAALSLKTPGDREYAVNGIADHLGQTNPQAAIAWIESLPPGTLRQSAVSNALQSAAMSDPRAVAAYLTGNPADLAQREVLYKTASSYSEQDPAAAATWAASLPIGPARNKALEYVMGNWAQTDPQSAIRYLSSVGSSGQMNGDALTAIARSWVTTDPISAMQWVKTLPDGPAKSSTLESAAANWATVDPAKAAAYVMAMAAGQQQIQMMEGVERAWDGDNPEAAAQWLANLPAAMQSPNMYGDIAYKWNGVDPAAALAWIQNLPNGPGRDNAAHVYSSLAVSSNPAEAFASAESINDPKMKQSALLNVFQTWQKSDPNAAAAAAAQSSLSPEQKAKFVVPTPAP